jgi:hypothetical protein
MWIKHPLTTDSLNGQHAKHCLTFYCESSDVGSGWEITVELVITFHRDRKEEASMKKGGPGKFVQMALLRSAFFGP